VDGGIYSEVDGFFIYYAPFDRDDSLYEKHVVHGSTVRHAVLSRLSEATPYSIRMTSFGIAGPGSVGGESDFSNSVVKATLGQYKKLRFVSFVNDSGHTYYRCSQVCDLG